MIYIVEGADGTGKSTLVEEISREKNAHIEHCSYRKEWDILAYHQQLMISAQVLSEVGINVVFDRWAPSEAVYGEVFRGGESYDVEALIKNYGRKAIWVYCWNENALENHEKNKEERPEMFEDMSEVVKKYGEFVLKTSDYLLWNQFNFNHNNVKEFVKELP